MRKISTRLLAMLALILGIGALGLLARQFSWLEWIVEHENRLRELISANPWQAWLIGFLVYTLFSLVPGTAGKSVVFGWLFGFWQAVVLVDLGLTIAGIVGFLAARYFLRDWVRLRFQGLIETLDQALKKNGVFCLIMLRVAHVPYSLANYCVGATSVPCARFAWTTAVGLLPGTMIFVLVGTRIPTLAMIRDQGIWPLLDPLLFGLLAASFLFPLMLKWSIGQFQRYASASPQIDFTELESMDRWKKERNSNASA